MICEAGIRPGRPVRDRTPTRIRCSTEHDGARIGVAEDGQVLAVTPAADVNGGGLDRDRISYLGLQGPSCADASDMLSTAGFAAVAVSARGGLRVPVGW